MKCPAVPAVAAFLLLGAVVPASSAPARRGKEIVLVPAHQMPLLGLNPYQYRPVQAVVPYPSNLRGPFSFVGDWIQQSSWFPVEVNVPDTVGGVGNGFQQFTTNVGNGVSQLSQNIGSNFQQFSQNVGNGFQQFTQNVGSGLNSWMQNVGQRVPWLGNLFNTRPGTKVVVVVPNGQDGDTDGVSDVNGVKDGEDKRHELQQNYLVFADDFAEAFV